MEGASLHSDDNISHMQYNLESIFQITADYGAHSYIIFDECVDHFCEK